MYRSFQREFEAVIKDIQLGRIQGKIWYVAVTPGGGKSCLPLMLTQLIPHHVDKLCWIVPRVVLASQAESVFVHKGLQSLFPHTARIRHDTNTPNPTRGLQGYATTYNAVANCPELHAKEFARFRYALFLDEPHHVKTHFEQPEHPDLSWSQALQPLIDQAAFVIYASGTFERHDQKPIHGVPYRQTTEGYVVDFPPTQTIRYRRQQALYEKAIVPLHFIVRNGKAVWRDVKGEEIERESFDETSYESGQMLDVVLETEFARQLLADTVEHWRGHRQHCLNAKLLVVAPRISLARKYVAWLKTDHGLTVKLATSNDTKEAKEAIDAFKGRRQPALDVLVTVGMAYEGLDVPDITHIACLTRYRSRPWLEQCFARACRTRDGKHAGYIFAPDDPLLNQVMNAIIAEQEAVARDTPNGESSNPGTGGCEPFGPDPKIVPLRSKATEMRAYDFQQSMSREETARIALVMQQQGILGVSPLQLKRAIDALEVGKPGVEEENIDEEELTPTEIEDRYKKRIDDHTKSADYHYFDGDWGATSTEILRAGFKGREGMGESELRQLWEWLQNRYPLGPLSEEEVV